MLIQKIGQNIYNSSFKATVVKPPIIIFVGPTEEKEKRKRETSHFELKRIPHMSCACCGKEVVTFKEIDAFQKSMENATGTELRHNLRKKWHNYKETEKRVVRRLIKSSYKHEDKNLQELLQLNFDNSRQQLIETQKNILIKVKNISNNLEGNVRPSLQEYINNNLEIIESQDIIFKRKSFLQKLTTIAATDKNPNNKETLKTLLAKAESIPNSSSDINAFTVKYSRRSSKEIAARLLARSAATAEHIKAFMRDGSNENSNFLLECNKCNEERSSTLFREWVEKTPKLMPNVQKFIRQVIELIKKGQLKGYEQYPLEVRDTLKRESGGIIDIDLDDYENFLKT